MDSARRAKLEATTRWDPAEAEARIFADWFDSGVFTPPAEGTPDRNYSIAIPPPNVTGALHMGHALNGTVQDALTRLNRMRGRNALWILGTDHAGIGTQMVVEKELRAQGTSRHELGREAFLERVWEWRERYGGQIVEQYKRLGASCDYEHERFTLDEGYVRAVYRVFVALYEKGLIYRDNYLVNWDPGSRSAISDLEVVNQQVTDTLYEIDYPLEDGDGALTVATVRPETMLADTAVAVHPDDDRYRELVGRFCTLPLVGRRLPIIADEHVDPEFGTGALKITPGHDPNDFEIGRRNELEEISVIGEDGRMSAAAGEAYEGLSAGDASAAVVAALREQGLIRGERPYEHSVPFSERSGERIEPLISLQWFCRMEELAAPAIEVVERDEVRIVPENYKRVYLDWMRRDQAVVRVAPALVGPPDPGLVRPGRRGDRRRVGGAGGRGGARARHRPGCAGAGDGRARHLVQLGAVAVRDPRLARRDPLFAGLLSHQLPDDRAGDHLPLGRADGDDGDRVRRRHPVPRRLRPPGRPGAGRPPDVEVARHRDRPARRDRCPRRRRAALRAARDVIHPGRSLLARPHPAGPRPREQDVERVAAHPAQHTGRAGASSCAGGRRARGPAGDARGPVDPVAAAARGRRLRGRHRLLRLRPRGARLLRVLLVRALRLVPRGRQAAPLRRRRGRRGEPALRARAGARRRASR